jgi:vacuolar-type H+-ATPase subunit C/Vma6
VSRSCDYANARIAARRARLLGPAGLRELAIRSELEGQLDVLRRSLWGRALGQERADALRDIPAVERALAAEESTQRAEIETFVERGARETLRAVLLPDAAAGLAILLRGVGGGEQAEEVLARHLEVPDLPMPVARAVAAAPNLEGAATALEAAGSALAPILRGALPAARGEPAQLHLEVAMQRAALAHARAAALRERGDGAALRDAVTLHTDHVNAATLLSVETAAHAQDLHLEGGRLGRAHFARLAALPPAERLAPLASFVNSPGLGRRLGPSDLARPGAAEQRLAAIRERSLHRAARARPLGLAVPVAWLVAIRGELRRIRLVLRGTAFAVPADELLELVEA